MEIFDTHSHYDWEEFNKDRNELFKEMNEKGIYAVNIGINIDSINKVIGYSKENKNLYFAIGIHPMEVEKEIDFKKIEDIAKANENNQKLLAIRRNWA